MKEGPKLEKNKQKTKPLYTKCLITLVTPSPLQFSECSCVFIAIINEGELEFENRLNNMLELTLERKLQIWIHVSDAKVGILAHQLIYIASINSSNCLHVNVHACLAEELEMAWGQRERTWGSLLAHGRIRFPTLYLLHTKFKILPTFLQLSSHISNLVSCLGIKAILQ